MTAHTSVAACTHDRRCFWHGELTWRRTAELREALFDLLEEPALDRLLLDVSAVETIDRTGVALLVGGHHRAAAMSRRLILVDRGGTVAGALSDAGVLGGFVFDGVPAVRDGVVLSPVVPGLTPV